MADGQLRHNIYFPIETENIKIKVQLTERCWQCGDNEKEKASCDICANRGYQLTTAGRILKMFVEECCNQ